MARRPSEQARFEILLEQMQSDLRTVAEGHGGLKQQIEDLTHHVTRLDQKIVGLDQKVEHGFATLGQRVSFVEAAVLDVRGDLRRLEQRLEGHFSAHAA